MRSSSFARLLFGSLVCLYSVSAVGCRAQAIPQKPGATFSVAEKDLSKQPNLIVYGDMRFTDPTEREKANPKARVDLVEQIAKEHPDAVQLTGDVPLAGGNQPDYAQYAAETGSWRTGKLRIYPALGNHEFAGRDKEHALDNWWGAFPELKGMRWYSVALGRRIYLIQLDSTSDLTPGTPQRVWLEDQVAHMDSSVDFVFVAMHHPPMADIQTHLEVDHNPRPNEISLRDYLSSIAPTAHAKFIVTAGHIHNYERFEKDGVVYLVSGGGGAKPYFVERTKDDLYQDPNFPNFHYVRFVLDGKEMKATMYRIGDPTTAKPEFQAKDLFTITAK
jgi:hypothetical protein